MPRMVAPRPSEGFHLVLSKPFDGTPTQQIEVIGEPNRPSIVRHTKYTGADKSSEKKGEISQDDTNELLSLVDPIRGFPSNATKDIYGVNAKLDFALPEIQWSNGDEDPAAAGGEVAEESKDEFKRVVESIEALARTFAKQDSAI